MKMRAILLLVVLFAALGRPSARPYPESGCRPDTVALAAARDIGLTPQETRKLEELLREKFDSLDRRMYGITDPVERSAIARRTHGEFTAKLRATYSPQKSNHIEGWYYNYMNRNNN